MSATKLLSAEAFRELARAGRTGGVGVLGAARAEAAADDRSRTIRFVLSDGTVDRMGDTIAVDGWQLASFRKNPVVLWAHDAMQPAIGRASGLKVQNGKLVADVEFAPPEVNEFADTVFKLVREGYMRAGSVGFLPIKYAFNEEPGRGFGIDFLEQELLEFSIVPVPANANALAEARAKGIRISGSHLAALSPTPLRDAAARRLAEIRTGLRS